MGTNHRPASTSKLCAARIDNPAHAVPVGTGSADARQPLHDGEKTASIARHGHAEQANTKTAPDFPPFVYNGAEFPVWLLTTEQVEGILNVGRTFVSERVAAGDLKPIKFGTSRRAAVRFFAHDLYAYLAKLAAQRVTDKQREGQQP